MDVEVELALCLDVSLQVGHFEVIVDPVDDEVGEPGVRAARLEQFIEKLQAFLSEVVAEYFETHEVCVLREGLSEQRQT